MKITIRINDTKHMNETNTNESNRTPVKPEAKPDNRYNPTEASSKSKVIPAPSYAGYRLRQDPKGPSRRDEHREEAAAKRAARLKARPF